MFWGSVSRLSDLLNTCCLSVSESRVVVLSVVVSEVDESVDCVLCRVLDRVQIRECRAHGAAGICAGADHA